MKILLGAALLTAYGISMAQCPSNLNAEQMYRCIVVEGAGDEYEPPVQLTEATDDKKQADADTQTDDVKLAHNNEN